MKRLLVFAIAMTAALSAYGAGSALTADGSRYSVEPSAESPALLLVRVSGDVRDTFAVPTTDDDAVESEPHVAYDALTGALYVVWTRSLEGAEELRYAVRGANGEWSAPQTIASGAERILGSQVVVTHGVDEDPDVSLIHVAWWKVAEAMAEPWYALVALERGQEPVTSFANLVDLAALSVESAADAEPEDTGAAVHPPLAMSRNGQEVNVVFGARHETTVTSVVIKPRKVAGTARIFVPGGRMGTKTPRANLVSSSAAPLQAFISRNGRIALYASGERFSYVVLDNGEWTPVRSLKVDEKLTLDHVLQDLRNTVEELETLSLPQTDR
ncbi:MAG TPA: hypothetical protein VFP80_10500 [Thermoanaerobaculia bacterium]|nr:hypothetical protein [Thermoanaerobaculia bacterium]